MSKKISIVILLESIKDLKRTIDSIEKQKKSGIEVEIIIEVTSKKQLKELQQKEYLDGCNVIIDYKETLCDRLNSGLSLASGDIISFISSDMYYKKSNVFVKIVEKLDHNNMVSIQSIYLDIQDEKEYIYKMQPGKSGVIDLEKTPYVLSLNLCSFFINKNIIGSLKFDKAFKEESIMKFLIELLNKEKKYFYYNEGTIYSLKPFEDNNSKTAIQYNEWWYIDSLKNFDNFYKKIKSVSPFMQEILMYIIFAKINCNIYDRNKNIISNDLDSFIEQILKCLMYIDNKIIIQSEIELKEKGSFHLFKIPRWFAYWLLIKKIKLLSSDVEYNVNDDNIEINYSVDGKNHCVKNSDVESETIKVVAINYKKGKLVFDCETSISDILPNDLIDIELYYGGKKISINRTNCYPLLKAFGHTFSEKYPFQFSIDLDLTTKKKITAYAKINDKKIRLDFKYKKVHARLSSSKHAFWHYKNFVLYNKINCIVVERANRLKLIWSEIKFDLSKLKNVNNKLRVIKLIGIRMIYYITKPFYKNKHIWLTWDKLYKAGDNGEYMYQYCLKNNRNIYYVIKKDSPDYKRLIEKNKKHVIVFNSLKEKIFALHAEVILDTHANVISYSGYDGISRHFICGLFNPEVICIQHGLTIQKIAQFQSRLFDNIKYYCCASQFEIDNISDSLYDYSSDQMGLTGLARYDGLKNNDKKIILITPTWRRNVVNSSIAYIKKKHNDNFKNSDYYKIYNSLINNNELIDTAKKTGYKIIYLLHPAMSGQLEDFDKNDFVDIIPATGDMNYEKILTESSLMVTDYSGVQFDFAYQRKVLIYYHPDKLPPHYEAGGLDYENMGFGPVCKDEKTIIEELCNYMKSGCRIKEKYKKRADKFFAFDDHNNCKRILSVVDEYLRSINR